jgi:hypothetical protein
MELVATLLVVMFVPLPGSELSPELMRSMSVHSLSTPAPHDVPAGIQQRCTIQLHCEPMMGAEILSGCMSGDHTKT